MKVPLKMGKYIFFRNGPLKMLAYAGAAQVGGVLGFSENEGGDMTR